MHADCKRLTVCVLYIGKVIMCLYGRLCLPYHAAFLSHGESCIAYAMKTGITACMQRLKQEKRR